LGNAIAMKCLGYCYEVGKGVPQGFSKVIKWYNKAVQLKNENALFNLAICLENGRRIEKNFIQAMNLFEESAVCNFTPSSFKLFLYHSNGIGKEREYR
jgi:TPR repeat protein